MIGDDIGVYEIPEEEKGNKRNFQVYGFAEGDLLEALLLGKGGTAHFLVVLVVRLIVCLLHVKRN